MIRDVYTDPRRAAAEVTRRVRLRIASGISAVEAHNQCVTEYLADCRGRMRGRDLYRLQDIFTGQTPPMGKRIPAPPCKVCGGMPTDGWSASVETFESLCAPCGVWALGFEYWDDAVERARAESERSILVSHDPGCAICLPV